MKDSEDPRKRAERKENVDDAIAIAEIMAEDLSGVGMVKRVYERLKRRAAREYLEKIDELEEAHRELMRTNAVLTRACEDAMQRQDELIAELKRLQDKNDVV